jgi:hypothetical protein
MDKVRSELPQTVAQQESAPNVVEHLSARLCNCHMPVLVLLLCPRVRILVQLAAQLNWPPEDGLVRLENFKEPWQRALCR